MESETETSSPAAGTLAPRSPLARPELAEALRAALRRRAAPATLAAHTYDLAAWARWCGANGVPEPLGEGHPADLDLDIAWTLDQSREGHRLSSIRRRLASLSWAHRARGLASPCREDRVRAVLEGLARDPERPRERQRAPLGVAEVQTVVSAVVATMARGEWSLAEGTRAIAAVCLGLATALRCDDLARLRLEDVTAVPWGLSVLVRRSKTDQTGAGRAVDVLALPGELHDPVSALLAWKRAAHLEGWGEELPARGLLFRATLRNGRSFPRCPGIAAASLAKEIARAAELAGLPVPPGSAGYGGHSLRAGFVTEARRKGVHWVEIMDQTGHKRIETVKRYDRTGAESPARLETLRRVFT